MRGQLLVPSSTMKKNLHILFISLLIMCTDHLDIKNCVCAIQRNLSINKRLIRNTTVRAVALRRHLVELHPKVTASPTSTLRSIQIVRRGQ
ncbi:hypothetical protein CY34DRAFT_153946 [Suillus luteus UH-Slu-Lm8-n1]|uniref:Secreted protein n=1 Tax=Suillus luteus UH-Slu-Lm8-n1 TaxID=930992 RepID=A0A0C9ZX02_9AGAM|nr:hypothetical protein CY34DRAFT_153946 [Suillus luteus UH-Slu-Lm8-n1]